MCILLHACLLACMHAHIPARAICAWLLLTGLLARD